MSGYSWVSVISIFCYMFLLLTFVASKKREKVIRSFMLLLGIMILWNGGSFGMRMQLWPSVNFWHHVSLLGMLMLPYGYFQFMLNFLDEGTRYGRKVWLAFYVLVFIFNCFTGFFIPLPQVVHEGGSVQFLYHYNWHIYVLFAFIAVTVIQLAFLVWRHCRGNRIAFGQLKPVIGGVAIILVGHILATLPMFVGLPVDMLSGAVNTIFLFYALYKKKLFHMSILLSKSNYGIIAMVLGLLIFSDFSISLHGFLQNTVGMDFTLSMFIIAALLCAMVALLYLVINRVFDRLFTRTEQKQKEALTHFAEEITHMLHVEDILQAVTDTVLKVLELNRLFILIREVDGSFRIAHTINPLEGKNFYIRADHPVVRYFERTQDSGECLLLQDFNRKLLYRGMWESEKALLISQQIECFVPIRDDEGLIGFMMLSGKNGKPVAEHNSLRFLQSVSGLCVGAIKNAYSYERALKEAQKDNLTGLINQKFFYEVLESEFEQHRNTALSLCLFNIDDFKVYNQLYGSREGDTALQRVGSILQSSINEGCYAARLGGDRFALILPGYDIYSAKAVADTVCEQIGGINSAFGGAAGRLTVSAGICAAPYMASSAKELYRNADTAVYSVKRTGKNAVQMYSADINRRDPSPSQHKSGYSENAGTIYALTAAIDAKDHYTFQHSQNVAYYAAELAKAAGMTPDLVEIVREAGLLHDIGKIGIHEDILNKPSRLTPEEYEAMKGHVENAVNIIRHLPSLDYVIPAVYSHHERYDGRGYPRRLAEDSIPITGRILCIADSFDAITSIRNYKDATPVAEALEIMRSEAGKQFDPDLAELFIHLVEEKKIELRIPNPMGE